jgi:cholesterol transport system auxiliary component
MRRRLGVVSAPASAPASARSFAVWLALSLLLAAGGSACALTSKGEALTIRYFTPEHAPVRLTGATVSRSPAAQGAPSRQGASRGTPLRLGRITSGSDLRERIVHRESGAEVGFYDDRRWTERPQTYVRRALSRTLFEERGFDRVISGAAPTLDVEVLAFEELELPAGHVARIRLRVVLHDDTRALLEETLTVDRPAAGGGTAAFASAMGDALVALSERVASDVAARVATATAAPPACAPPPR